MNFLRSLLTVWLCWAGFALAQFEFSFAPTTAAPSHIATAASASVGSYKPGESFDIALVGTIDKPWHAYYRNPATVGEPMEATMRAPEGFKVEGPYWRAPMREEGVTGVSYAYEEPVVIWRVTPAEDAPAEASFELSSSTQVCSDQGCLEPRKQTVTLKLSKGDGAPSPDWRAELPSLVETLGDTPTKASAEAGAKEIVLRFSAEAPVESAYFFSDDNCVSPTAEQKLEKTEGGYALRLPLNDGKDMLYPLKDEAQAGKAPATLQGVLVFGDRHARLSLPVATAAAPTSGSAPSEAGGGLALLFGSLFLGGLILNLMPCVFPVIGLKIMAFVELGGGERRKVFLHALTFVLGVLVSFWVISALLVLFSNLEAMAQVPWTQWASVLWNDAGAGSRSWAAWMQNPWIVYVILLLLLALGLSMFGVFEVGVGATGAGQSLQNKKGLAGSFFSGLFVTVVATPCSAPFLGTAMPAAMALPGPQMMLALTFMALGLAFPYVVLGAFPGLVKLLPRPGAWMESLKQGLSFLLFAAAAWMLDVYLAFVPAEQSTRVMWMLVSLVGVAAAFWVYGRWCPIYRSRKSRWTGLVVALALAAVSVYGSMPRAAAQATEAPSAAGYVAAQGARPVWNAWSRELMDEALEAGHPVFVDFTAHWCMTCQANKQIAYSDAVYARMAASGVVLMRADKTRPSPAIDEELRRLGRSSVPTNALYLPGQEPAVTRELLTADYLLGFLEEKLAGFEPEADEEEEAEEEDSDEEEEVEPEEDA